MDISKYKQELANRELAKATKKLYLRAVKDFLEYVKDKEITQTLLIEYKKELLDKYKTSTVNTKITIINNYLSFLDKDISVKHEKTQRSNVLDNVLSETDYTRLIRVAKNKGKARTRAIMQVLYYTGIRVSEIEFLTVEALRKGYIDIENKGKHRRVPITNKLTRELKQFIQEEGIEKGYIIRNKQGDPLSRSYIFRELKYIGGQARVRKDKVYPHSFRHLFAKQWLRHNKNNILSLADLLGHSSLETTRIYTTLSTDEQRETINF